jgi:hypothetical protein
MAARQQPRNNRIIRGTGLDAVANGGVVIRSLPPQRRERASCGNPKSFGDERTYVPPLT